VRRRDGEDQSIASAVAEERQPNGREKSSKRSRPRPAWWAGVQLRTKMPCWSIRKRRAGSSLTPSRKTARRRKASTAVESAERDEEPAPRRDVRRADSDARVEDKKANEGDNVATLP